MAVKNDYRVGTSPLTGDIYCGRVSKNNIWVGEKHHVTSSAVAAVAEHLIFKKESAVFNDNKGNKIVLSIMAVTPSQLRDSLSSLFNYLEHKEDDESARKVEAIINMIP